MGKSSKPPRYRDPPSLYHEPVSEEAQQIPSASSQDGVEAAWSRLTDEPEVHAVEAWLHGGYGWVVTVWAQEFYRQDDLGDELRECVARALESVDGVTGVAEHDNESWRVMGTASGQALTCAAANVVDDLADRLLAGLPHNR
jgi:hypothetical protein